MKVNRIDVVISTHANKNRTYLYEEMFGFAKEHKIQGRFGQDYFELESVPEEAIGLLEKMKIKFEKYVK